MDADAVPHSECVHLDFAADRQRYVLVNTTTQEVVELPDGEWSSAVDEDGFCYAVSAADPGHEIDYDDLLGQRLYKTNEGRLVAVKFGDGPALSIWWPSVWFERCVFARYNILLAMGSCVTTCFVCCFSSCRYLAMVFCVLVCRAVEAFRSSNHGGELVCVSSICA